MKLYILTEEYNEYDQYGKYFLAWFTLVPTISQLTKLEISKEDALHILKGGGRRGTEQTWYNLHEVEEGTFLTTQKGVIK